MLVVRCLAEASEVMVSKLESTDKRQIKMIAQVLETLGYLAFFSMYLILFFCNGRFDRSFNLLELHGSINCTFINE